MSAGIVSICNRALQILGSGTLTAINEDSTAGRVMSVAYEPVRDAELGRRRWRFSIKRASIPALATAPDSDFGYEYPLPGDYLRLIEGGDIVASADLSDYRGSPAALYQVEGKAILTNLPAPLAVRYIARITDVSMFSPPFCEALAARIAYECCYRITESTAKEETCLRRYTLAIREAVQANAIERAPESIGDDTWVMARTQ